MLLGHKIGLASAYYKPTEDEMLNEYLKAVPLLTISNEERLKFKLDARSKGNSFLKISSRFGHANVA